MHIKSDSWVWSDVGHTSWKIKHIAHSTWHKYSTIKCMSIHKTEHYYSDCYSEPWIHHYIKIFINKMKYLQWLTAQVLIHAHRKFWSILMLLWLNSSRFFVFSESSFVPSESKKSIVAVFSELSELLTWSTTHSIHLEWVRVGGWVTKMQ